MQDSVLRPGSIPGTPITGVFVAVRHRSVTNNNNFKKSLFNFSIQHWASMCRTRIATVGGGHYPAAAYLRNGGEPE